MKNLKPNGGKVEYWTATSPIAVNNMCSATSLQCSAILNITRQVVRTTCYSNTCRNATWRPTLFAMSSFRIWPAYVQTNAPAGMSSIVRSPHPLKCYGKERISTTSKAISFFLATYIFSLQYLYKNVVENVCRFLLENVRILVCLLN